jgi:hypothetical protein
MPRQPKHVGKCGHAVTRAEYDSCRACWRKRGSDVPKGERLVHAARLCGHPVSKPGLDRCRACWNGAATTAQSVNIAGTNLDDGLRRLLKAQPRTIEELGTLVERTPGQVLDALLAMRGRGVNIHEFHGRWSLERIVTSLDRERTFTYTSRADNTYVFGSASDAHLGSKYARLDVLNDLYDRFERAKVDRVFNAGNWIDGEDDKNRFDLQVHGLEPQVDHLAQEFPKRGGIDTYAVWGEDHEGWFARRESIDVGRFAEGKMREAGRTDWHDLGFIEAKVDLVNANTGATSSLLVMHPGGGSSYAYSYRSQKIVESLSGGEKPGVLIIGHYHKLNCNIIRNVWTIQAGTTMDQSVFMRKLGLEAHVGGMVVTLEQDPATGAIFRCVADQLIYYDRRYYNDRWSKTRPVVQAPRFLGGVVT